MDFLDRLRRRDSHVVVPTPEQPTVVKIDATALSRVFSAPMWLRDLGLLSWFLVGVGLVLVGAEQVHSVLLGWRHMLQGGERAGAEVEAPG